MTDSPGPRPVPIAPIPGHGAFTIRNAQLTGPDGTRITVLVVEVITTHGSAYASFDPDTLEPVLAAGVDLCRQVRTGLIRPLNGQRLIVPGPRPGQT